MNLNIPKEAWIIFAIGLLLIILYAVIKLIARGFNVGLFKFKGEKNNECPGSHVECHRHNDVMIVVSKTAEVTNFELTGSKIDLIQEQMDYADHVMNNLLNKLQAYYIEELKKRRPEMPITKSDDFLDYEKTLELFKARLMNSFRKFCKQNHFSEMGEDEFENYRNIKARSLMNEGSKYLNDLYMYQVNITREDLYKINEPHIPEFLNTIKDIITNARKVAIRNKIEIIEKNKELLELLKTFVGEDSAILEVWQRQKGLI
jgi:hypothetical protein